MKTRKKTKISRYAEQSTCTKAAEKIQECPVFQFVSGVNVLSECQIREKKKTNKDLQPGPRKKKKDYEKEEEKEAPKNCKFP